jgi:transposase, IS5 family
METVPMRPAKTDPAEQPDMFRETLEAILDPRHELLELGRRIDWAALDAVCGATFVDQVGRPGLPTRLMVGLHILKHVKGLSDEAALARPGWRTPTSRRSAASGSSSTSSHSTAAR